MKATACGSTAGYARHRRLGQLPCQPCRDARAEPCPAAENTRRQQALRRTA